MSLLRWAFIRDLSLSLPLSLLPGSIQRKKKTTRWRSLATNCSKRLRPYTKSFLYYFLRPRATIAGCQNGIHVRTPPFTADISVTMFVSTRETPKAASYRMKTVWKSNSLRTMSWAHIGENINISLHVRLGTYCLASTAKVCLNILYLEYSHTILIWNGRGRPTKSPQP